MAFHLHLIDPLRDIVPAAGSQPRHNIGPEASAEARLTLQWGLDADERPQSRWTIAHD